MGTIFAWSKPFNLTNEVIFVQNPKYRADKKEQNFRGKVYQRGGKNEFPCRKHSTLSHVRIIRRVAKTAGCKVPANPKIASRSIARNVKMEH